MDAELSCVEAAGIIRDAILSVEPEAECILLPLSGGGLGTVDALQYTLGGKRFTVPAHCADDRMRNVDYLMLADYVAIVEAAQITGAQFNSGRSPGGMTSYGVGSVAVDAIRNGAKKLIFALGDTYCIDGGAGIARAFGALFLSERGKGFLPTGVTLDEVCFIDRTRLLSMSAVGLCDTDDLLMGSVGVVGRHEREVGSYPAQMPHLMENLKHLHELVNPEMVGMPGDGAGGGAGYILRTMFDAKLQPGAKFMIESLGFSAAAENADWVITAVPRLDIRMATNNFFTALRASAPNQPLSVIGLNRSDEFCEAQYQLASTETIAAGKRKTPMNLEEKKQRLFDAAVRLAKTLQ